MVKRLLYYQIGEGNHKEELLTNRVVVNLKVFNLELHQASKALMEPLSLLSNQLNRNGRN